MTHSQLQQAGNSSASATTWKRSSVAIAEDTEGKEKKGMCHSRRMHTKIQMVQREMCLCSV